MYIGMGSGIGGVSGVCFAFFLDGRNGVYHYGRCNRGMGTAENRRLQAGASDCERLALWAGQAWSGRKRAACFEGSFVSQLCFEGVVSWWEGDEWTLGRMEYEPDHSTITATVEGNKAADNCG